jgi:hypothetical protein
MLTPTVLSSWMDCTMEDSARGKDFHGAKSLQIKHCLRGLLHFHHPLRAIRPLCATPLSLTHLKKRVPSASVVLNSRLWGLHHVRAVMGSQCLENDLHVEPRQLSLVQRKNGASGVHASRDWASSAIPVPRTLNEAMNVE